MSIIIGRIVAFREATKQRYVVDGYLCKYIKKVTEPVDETANPAFWDDPKESMLRFETDIKILEETGRSQFELSVYEAKVYNRKTARLFIEESLRS